MEYGARSIFRYGSMRQIGAPDSRGCDGDIETHTRCKAMEESDEHPRQALTRMQIGQGMWKSPYRGRRQTYKDTKSTNKTNRKVDVAMGTTVPGSAGGPQRTRGSGCDLAESAEFRSSAPHCWIVAPRDMRLLHRKLPPTSCHEYRDV